MKAFFITTTTNETHKHHESFASLPGNEVKCYVYVHAQRRGVPVNGARLDAEIYAAAQAYAPDLIVYIGACGGNVPSVSLFQRLRKDVAPTVHFCSDASDAPWWPLLTAYEKARCFSLQVALDGSDNWPMRDSQLTALTVVEPAFFKNAQTRHSERPMIFGFAGNAGGRRANSVKQLIASGLNVRQRDGREDSYKEFADFLCKCRITINFPDTGSGRYMHVKGRVIEAGYCGVLLLERRNSPTKNWFTPGVDYVEYDDINHAKTLVAYYADHPEEAQAISDRLRARVTSEHGPTVFWGRVFDRLGFTKEPQHCERNSIDKIVERVS